MIQRPRAQQEPWNMPGILHIYRVRGVVELFVLPQRSSNSKIMQLVLPRTLCYPPRAPRQQKHDRLMSSLRRHP